MTPRTAVMLLWLRRLPRLLVSGKETCRKMRKIILFSWIANINYASKSLILSIRSDGNRIRLWWQYWYQCIAICEVKRKHDVDLMVLFLDLTEAAHVEVLHEEWFSESVTCEPLCAPNHPPVNLVFLFSAHCNDSFLPCDYLHLYFIPSCFLNPVRSRTWNTCAWRCVLCVFVPFQGHQSHIL